jgi:peptide/nickel transport system permease protein
VLVFLLRRLAWGVVVVAATALIAFAGLRALRPELFEGVGLVEGVRADFRELLSWELKDQGFTQGRTMEEILADGWLTDVYFMLGTLAIGIGGGFAAGVWCANRRGRPLARLLEALAMLALCTPVYVIGLTLLLLFAPPFGIWEFPLLFELHTYVAPVENPITFLRAMAVPWVVTALPLGAIVLRLTLSAIADVMQEDYMRTAQGKGLSRRQAVRRHAAPAAYLPVASFVSVSVPLIVTNMVLTEIVFNVPGVFRYFKKAIEGPAPPGPDPDYPSLQVFAIYAAVFIVIGTIIADYVVERLDPKART